MDTDYILKVEYLPVTALSPYKNNARNHSTLDVDAIKASIEKFGFDDPIGIWGEDNVIVEGHGRLKAAQALGIESVPVIRLDHLTDEERRAYALAHNRTAELSGWNVEALSEELEGICDIDMSAFGLSGKQKSDRIIDDGAEENNPTVSLPESKVYVFGVSAFGTNSEVFLELKLEQDDADQLLSSVKNLSAAEIAQKIRGAINAL